VGAGRALGVIATMGFEAGAQSAKQACTGESDLSRIRKRFDDLEQAITALQKQSAKAASDDALANANTLPQPSR
jgi:hypothetical protein